LKAKIILCKKRQYQVRVPPVYLLALKHPDPDPVGQNGPGNRKKFHVLKRYSLVVREASHGAWNSS
jgi:hypothetical protein